MRTMNFLKRRGAVGYLSGGLLLLLVGGLLLPTVALANTTVNFSVTVIDPPPCKINDGNDVSVNFGTDVLITRVNGENYKQPVPYNLTCVPEPSSNALKLQFTGQAAGFDSALATSNSNLGIKLLHGDTVLPINSWLNFTWPAAPEINAVLVKRPGSTLSPGVFSGVATMLVLYQ
ncbi:MAG: fimbrial protein [Serratia sp. (in: enterobacteria)]|uniref:fimbrial protein n=1 Tax=Serratia sp. (in: enterobacteria) TaxID=616 RepID=UPI003F30F28A